MPTTTGKASELITFSRTSNATVTDSDGKIKWAPHNLLLASEQFDASNWTKTSTTPTANAVAAPNGTTTADTLTASGANGTTLQSYTSLGVSYTFGIWLKRKTGTGNIQIAADSGTYTTVTITSDWALYTVTQTPAAGTISAGIRIVTSADAVEAWGASLYRSDLGGMKANTSAYPMYNPTTPKNLLGYTENWGAGWNTVNGGLQGNGVELVTNGDFASDTNWTKGTGWTISGGAASFSAGTGAELIQTGLSFAANKTYEITFNMTQVSGGGFRFVIDTTGSFVSQYFNTTARHSLVFTVGATSSRLRIAALGGSDFSIENISIQETAVYEAPNGLQTARAVEATAANGTLLSSVSLLASPYTFSVWLKRKTGGGNVQLTVDGTTYTTVDVNSTWTRFSTTLTPTAGTKTPGIRLVTSGDAVYIWGAQLSDSASLDTYVPNYGAAPTAAAYYGPRLDYDPVTLAAKGLLVEESRANLQLNSNVFGTSTFAATVVAGAAASPSGLIDASSLACTSTTGRAILSTSVTSGVVYTFSVFIKAGTNTSAYIELAGTSGSGGAVVFNLSSGIITSGTGGSIVPAPNGFYRCSVTSTATGTGASDMRIGTGDATSKTIFIYGAQLEAGSFATSYIPTGAATATRAADVASVSTNQFPYSATEGTLVVNASSPCIAAIANMITLDNGTTQERIRLLTDVASVKTIITESNTTQANLAPGSATANTPFKFAVAYKVNDFAAVVNGSAAATDTAGNVPVVNIARLGADSSGNYLNGHIRQITYIPRRLTNAELQTRSA